MLLFRSVLALCVTVVVVQSTQAQTVIIDKGNLVAAIPGNPNANPPVPATPETVKPEGEVTVPLNTKFLWRIVVTFGYIDANSGDYADYGDTDTITIPVTPPGAGGS